MKTSEAATQRLFLSMSPGKQRWSLVQLKGGFRFFFERDSATLRAFSLALEASQWPSRDPTVLASFNVLSACPCGWYFRTNEGRPFSTCVGISSSPHSPGPRILVLVITPRAPVDCGRFLRTSMTALPGFPLHLQPD